MHPLEIITLGSEIFTIINFREEKHLRKFCIARSYVNICKPKCNLLQALTSANGKK